MRSTTVDHQEIIATEERQMALLEQAKEALSAAKSIEDVLELRDQASALRAYARKKQLNDDSMQRLNALQIRVQRRLGEMTAAMARAQGRRSDRDTSSPRTTKSEALAAAGLTKQEANVCERLAAIPEKRFEAEVVKPSATVKSVARIAREYLEKAQRPKRQPEPPAPALEISDRILTRRGELFQARIEKFVLQASKRWPPGKSKSVLSRALSAVAHKIDESERREARA